MSLIESTQKQVLLEEAAKKGVLAGDLKDIPEIYNELLGVTDVGVQTFGRPLAPIYKAVAGDLVDVARISKFITGHARDMQVADVALSQAEDNLVFLGLEMWARTQLVKNRALTIAKAAAAEKARSALGGVWSFSDTFSDTSYVDMSKTTAWIDSSEGVATIASNVSDKIIQASELTILEEHAPVGGDMLGSSASMAFDGLDSTNWRATFTSNTTQATCTVKLNTPTMINAIQLDPVGYGTETIVEVDEGDGFKQALQAEVYQKETYPITPVTAKQLRVTFRSASAVLPKTAGLRSIKLFTSQVTQATQASVYSKLLQVTAPFSDIQINLDAKIPDNTSIDVSYSTDGVTWTKIDANVWNAARVVQSTNLNINTSLAQEAGLYSYPVDTGPLSATEGVLRIGVQQMEVSAFRKDYTELGESPHIPRIEDFDENHASFATTWLTPGAPTTIASGSGRLAQMPVERLFVPPINLTRGAGKLAVQRFVGADETAELCFILLDGGTSYNICQPNYTYRCKFMVYAESEIFIDSGKYWFIQGYRKRGARNYREINRSYGAFTFYVNGQMVAGDDQPFTAYDTQVNGTYLEDGGENGKGFSFTLLSGWNEIDILIHTIDPSSLGSDAYDVVYPYLQLSLSPSLFYSTYQNLSGIDLLLASGEKGPVSQFDLLWNLPTSPAFWAWSDDRRKILFNAGTTPPIDGYLQGGFPVDELVFKGAAADSAQQGNLYVRLDLVRENETAASPILSGYTVLVR